MRKTNYDLMTNWNSKGTGCFIIIEKNQAQSKDI